MKASSSDQARTLRDALSGGNPGRLAKAGRSADTQMIDSTHVKAHRQPPCATCEVQ
jgi:hypothetical protein